jgi:integration host factor subunit alpha
MSNSRTTATRLDLYNAVYLKAGFSRSETASLVELVLKEIKDSLANGETVKLASFGTFAVRKKGERMGRNPMTGVPALIPSRRVVLFKASDIMKQRINAGRLQEPSARALRETDMTGAPQT